MIDLKDYLAPGYSYEFRLIVTSEEAVGNFSPKLDQLLATSACVKAFIRAAIEETDKGLPEGTLPWARDRDLHEVPSYITSRHPSGHRPQQDKLRPAGVITVLSPRKHTRAVVDWALLMEGARREPTCRIRACKAKDAMACEGLSFY